MGPWCSRRSRHSSIGVMVQSQVNNGKRKCERPECNFCAHSHLAGIAAETLQWVRGNGSSTLARHCCYRCMRGQQGHGRYCQRVFFETANFGASPAVTSLIASEKRRKIVASFAPNYFITGGQPGADSIPFHDNVFEELGVRLDGFTFQTQIVVRYGLKEGDWDMDGDWNAWRDKKNADISDACLAFLTTLPKTGRGTMRTVNYFICGDYEHVHIQKPEEHDHLVLELAGTAEARQQPDFAGPSVSKPVIVFWDITLAKLDGFATALREFLTEHRPSSLMLAGSLEDTWAGTERLGAELLRRTLLLKAETAAT